MINNNFFNYSSYKARNNQKVSFKGWFPDNSIKTEKLSEIVEAIKNPEIKKIAISGHTRPDGDSICSEFALANMINLVTGKKIDLFIFGELPQKYNFLNTNDNINIISIYDKKEFKADKLKEKYGQYDLAIAVDTALKRLIPENYSEGIFANAKKTIKIDHHPYMEVFDRDTGEYTNNNFANYNYTDETCDSAAQVIMQMVKLFNIDPKSLPKNITEAIYSGLLSDTDNFKYARSANTFKDASLLAENGINNVKIQKKLSGCIPPIVHEIRKYLYNNILYSPDKKIAYFIEDENLLNLKKLAKEEGYKDEAQEEIMDFLSYLLKLKGVEISMKATGTNFSIRSNNTDVRSIANKYGGGGHENAVAFCVKKDKNISPCIVINQIIDEYRKQIERSTAFIKE